MSYRSQMNKTITIGLVALAFVAGSILTGTMAEAKKDKSEGNDNNPFKALQDAIAGLQTQITAVTNADGDKDSSNEDQTLSGTGEVVLGTTAAGDGGGTVTCADITGDASLCDGDDAVVDNDNDSSNELQILSGTGSVDLSNGGSSVSCNSITGGAGLCDGIDAVVDADSSTTNEIQTLSETNGIITLSKSGGSVTVQDRVSSSCAVGSSIRAIAADGTVTCETDDSGAANFQTYVEQNTVSPGFTVKVQCDPGDLAIGGGFFVNNPDTNSNFPIDVNGNYVLNAGSTGVATGLIS